MKDYQRDFISFCLDQSVLRFGSFTLKSGRISPWFFNAGLFNTGASLSTLGRFYAAAIQDLGLPYNVLFGPAYKGIPLVCSASVALSLLHSIDAPFAFNRKEKKDHGEGGTIVGSPLVGQVLVIDDVITAGTAINESIEIINTCGAKLAGVVVAVDRQEVAPNGSGKSAIQALEERYGVTVKAIISMEDIMYYLKEKGGYEEQLEKMEEYSHEYGIKK
ncbi:orotate phosphoribosyltransferase [Jimgerdemannia flammicorona]|uniref:orotate phosphoribosyltransferase n=2 Tax=Jimgerdemannia flammicorona TaxID=994334 RepID=A0A433CXT1_9FUNG|nr:orotate phosphoribosyltransferase [Jimgerdemannia flammicorona]RUS30383.1 orotate phosphoribosyltransferase [Jimgerdemannia flammicorona]